VGKTTGISWCDSTKNVWIGCTKVSRGCKNCYAETMMDKRFGKAKWGPRGTRHITADKSLKELYSWNRSVWVECQVCGWRGDIKKMIHGSSSGCQECGGECRITRRRIFINSLSDTFEDRQELEEPRKRLFAAMWDTTEMDYLILTKRAQNVNKMIELATGMSADKWLSENQHVWIGASAEDQESLDRIMSDLSKIKSSVRFLSLEPLLGPIGFDFDTGICECGATIENHDPMLVGHEYCGMQWNYLHMGIDWVIVGGESGRNARPMNPEWVHDIRGQCCDAGTPFYFKQGLANNWDNYKNFASFPDDLKIREYPNLDTQINMHTKTTKPESAK